MRRFLYFFPGVGGVNDGMLHAAGLADRFAGGTNPNGLCYTCGPAVGPHGAGCVVAAGEEPPRLLPSQVWQASEENPAGRLIYTAIEQFAPQAEDLAKDYVLPGYAITLGDGRKWSVPTFIRWNPACADDNRQPTHFPARDITQGYFFNGSMRTVVKPIFHKLESAAWKAFKDFTNGNDGDSAELFPLAVDLLAVNYRIGANEANLLGLIDLESIARILEISFDGPAIRHTASERHIGIRKELE